MKNRIISILILVILSSRIIAQPPETIYQGTVIKSGYVDDASYGPFNIGFNFTYFGISYSQFYASSNGLVLFTSDATNISGADVAIPDPAGPNNFIAAFWDDLVVDGTGKILYTTIGAAPNRKLIIQFGNMGFYGAPAFLGTFAVILNETSNIIQVQYRLIVDNTSTRAHGGNASIGIENSDGTAGVQYAYHNPAAVITGKALSYTPSGSTYTLNADAIYEGIFLTTNITLPDPGIPALLSPPQNAIIGSGYNFSWSGGGNSASYSLLISGSSDLGGATYYSAGSNTSYNVTGLTLDSTYYWGVFATNATGTTWCEIKKFTTSANPPLAAVPQTLWVEQNSGKIVKLQYTGGDASAKTAIITSLPAQGKLYQYNAGVKGSPITVVPASVADPGMNVIYDATGNVGNGAGNFNFKIHDATGDSPEVLITINVSPPEVPNVLYIAKSTSVEIQFDIPMADPSGKQNQFTVTVNGTPATINSAGLKTGDPSSIILVLATPLTGSETVLVSYTQGDVSGSTGGLLLSFTNQAVTLTAQTINFPVIPEKQIGDLPFNPGATASSGLGITYSSSNLSVATSAGSTVTILSVGTSDITARQAGNGTYASARYTRTLTVIPLSKLNQTITFGVLPAKTYGDADFAITASASSGLSVSFSSDNPAVATVTGNLVHIAGAGSAIITASQAGNTDYNAAPDVQQPLTIAKADQTITFSVLPDKTYGDIDFNISANASSMLLVSFSSDNPAVATVSAGLVHITGAGTAVITASQNGDGNYNAAPPIPQTLTVSKATLTFTADNKTRIYLDQNPDLTFNISGFVNGETKNVLDVLPSIQTTAVQNSPAGSYPITFSAGSDNNYSFVFIEGTLTVTKSTQTITFTDVPEKLLVKDTYTLVATSSSGLPVLFESSDVTIATVNGNLLTGVSKGDVQIRAYNSGNQNYEAADTTATVEIYSTYKNIMYLFTPNNDGFNDYWELPDLAAWGKCDVKVYNRWGKMVFSDPNYNNLWDGTSDGNPLPEGAYYFIIKTENAGMKKGTVNIVR
jgi:gliding motility-associated-like protein